MRVEATQKKWQDAAVQCNKLRNIRYREGRFEWCKWYCCRMRKLLKQAGTLWTTLAHMINQASLDLDLCLLICRKVMEVVNASDLGGMSFTPVWQKPLGDGAGQFVATVRYRAMGTVSHERYHNTGATKAQAAAGLTNRARATSAAAGQAPATTTAKKVSTASSWRSSSQSSWQQSEWQWQ